MAGETVKMEKMRVLSGLGEDSVGGERPAWRAGRTAWEGRREFGCEDGAGWEISGLAVLICEQKTIRQTHLGQLEMEAHFLQAPVRLTWRQ